MPNTTYIAELGTLDLTPELAVSALRNRTKAVEFGADQVGIAENFELKELDSPRRIALVCRVTLDDEKHDAIKHLLADGKAQMSVESYPIIGAVGP